MWLVFYEQQNLIQAWQNPIKTQQLLYASHHSPFAYLSFYLLAIYYSIVNYWLCCSGEKRCMHIVEANWIM
jgi:hypothetical protein